ncbi:MAG: MMPL family transporter, partial [Solirubrobacteraceae bacterium]
RTRVQALLAKVATLPDVGGVASPYVIKKQIAPGGTIGFATVTFDKLTNGVGSANSKTFVNTVTGASGQGLEFQVEGQVAEQGAKNNAGQSVIFGFIATAIVLFFVFGSIPAMLLPLLAAGAALSTAVALIGLLSHAMTIAPFSSQLALLIGLGVGVDYALFIVTRYRQAMLRGVPPVDAVAEAIDTSGRAVLFAGTIVCIAMLGMFALGVSFLYGVAIAATVAVAFTVIAALTLLPALIGAFGKRVLRRKDRKLIAENQVRSDDSSGAWERWTGILERHPLALGGGAALILVVLMVPFFGMRLGNADAGTDPTSSTTYKAYQLLAKGFGPGYNGPFEFVGVVSTPAQRAAFERVMVAIRHTPGVATSTPQPVFLPAQPGHVPIGVAFAIPTTSPQDNATTDLLGRLRNNVIPQAEGSSGLQVLVGGSTAIYDDFASILSSKMPLFLTLVIGLSFLLLMAVFRSIAVPLTAAVMNMLSAGAAFGVVTAVFQDGTGASLLGVNTKGPIAAFLPVIVFPIVFGLSMDYEVFLLSRIHEEWLRRKNNREAVIQGLAATGRTITAAAAIMVLVFAGFVLGGERVIQLFGVGLAGAVLLDALLVRCVLVPALMLLLGDVNWKLPSVLDRLLPRFNVEGSEPAPRPAAS